MEAEGGSSPPQTGGPGKQADATGPRWKWKKKITITMQQLRPSQNHQATAQCAFTVSLQHSQHPTQQAH